MEIIGIFSRTEVMELEPRPFSVMIQITTQARDFPVLKKGWKDIIQLRFDDVEGKETDIGSASNVLQDKQAEKLLDFVVKNLHCEFFIHCDAGISRSAGVAVALEKIFNGKDVREDYRFRHHNEFVKNKITDVWFKRVWFGKQEKKK